MTEFDERVNEKLTMFDDAIESMNGVQKALVQEIALEYCRVCVQLEDVDADVLEVGTTIYNTLGNVVKNPDVGTQQQLRASKVSIFTKLMKALPEGDAKDALSAFTGA